MWRQPEDPAVKASWLREPLVHFFLLGAVIFAIDALVPRAAGGARVIRVEKPLRSELVAKFENSTKRAPTPDELEQMVEAWVQREVLYREGVAMGLDRSDGFIRQRVIALVQALTVNKAEFDTPADDVLRAYYEQNKQAFTRPRAYDFEHFVIGEAEARADGEAAQLLQVLATGTEARVVGRRLLSIRGRSAAQVGAIFGDAFPGRLDALPVGQWQMVRSERDWHVLRVVKIDPGGLPPFEAVRGKVLGAWRQNQKATQAVSRYRAMRANYTVVDEGWQAKPGG
jgi:PPIC-type PPIASE domain